MHGVCVHFASLLLAEHLILDPSFLTQKALSALFHPDHAKLISNGILPHEVLQHIWPQHESRAEFLMNLMEKFEVCFELQPSLPAVHRDEGSAAVTVPLRLPFWERTSVITAYQPEQPPAKDFNTNVWPEECPRKTSQLRREYTFSIIPKELVSRLLVRLNPKMEAKLRWRTGLYLETSSSSANEKKKVQVLIRARLDVHELEVSICGAEVTVARSIMSLIGKEILDVSNRYPGITVDQDDSGGDSSTALWWEFEASESENWETRDLGASSLKILPVCKKWCVCGA